MTFCAVFLIILHFVLKSASATNDSGEETMRNIGIATGLLFLLTTQAFADELTLQQLREFQARQGVIVFAPVALELKDAKYELIAGEVAPDGGCKFSHTSEGNLADWPDDNAEAIIDVAIDRVRCEKVVMSGHLPMDDEMRKQLRNLPGRVIKGSENHTSGVETFDTFGIGELRTYAESSESTSSQSCCAATHAVGVYVEWDDGDHPVMQFFNTSITVNSADSKITYEGSHVCDAKKRGRHVGTLFVRLNRLRIHGAVGVKKGTGGRKQ